MNTTKTIIKFDTNHPQVCQWCNEPISPGEPMIVYGTRSDQGRQVLHVMHTGCDLKLASAIADS